MVSFVSSEQSFLCAILYCFLFLCCCLCFDLSVILGQVVSRSRFVVQVFNHCTLEREVRDSYEQDMFTFCIAAHTKRDYKRDYSQDKKKKQFNGAYLSTQLSRSFATASKNRTRQLQSHLQKALTASLYGVRSLLPSSLSFITIPQNLQIKSPSPSSFINPPHPCYARSRL